MGGLGVEDYEIIVSDSSDDRSAEIAKESSAVVVEHTNLGYGAAYLEGFKVAKGKSIIIGDSDNTYDFLEIPKFVSALRDCDFVIGSRFRGNMEKGSMKVLHKYIGNPALNYIFNVLFGMNLSDTHCGFRAFKKEVLDELDFKEKGMEFALEMIVKIAKKRYRIKEVPINYYKRYALSKLRTFRDGFNHLCFMVKEKWI